VGRPQYPTLRPAANDRFVTLINGSRLHLLSRLTGETVWDRDLLGNPAYGPAMGPDMVFVPAFDGQIEGYWLPTDEDSKEGEPPWVYSSAGRITGPPTVTTRTVSWVTDAGQMYITELLELKTRFRLDTAGPILGSTAALPPSTLIVASTDGYVFSVDEVTGAFNWDFSSGEAIRQSPVAVGDSVFAVTDQENLYCLAAQDGSQKWLVSHITGILTATQDRLYVSDRLGQIVALDLKTGGKLASVPAAGLDVRVVNAKTDRLYVGTRDGLLVCLETIGSEWPLIHFPLPEPSQETPAEADATGQPPRKTPADTTEQGTDQTEPPEDDPFGGGFLDNEPPAAGADQGGPDLGGGQPSTDQNDQGTGGTDDPFDFDSL
jgi:outer membrane protein assembly factor BamB